MQHHCFRCGRFVSEMNQEQLGGYCDGCMEKMAKEYHKEEVALHPDLYDEQGMQNANEK